MYCLRASLYTGHKWDEVKGKKYEKMSSDLLRELTEVEDVRGCEWRGERKMIML